MSAMKKFIIRSVALTAFAAMALTTAVRAELTAADFERSKNDNQAVAYVIGIGTAYAWANVSLLRDMQKPLYCPPLHLAVNGSNYIDLLNDAISSAKANNVSLDIPIPLLLLEQLKFTFPCR